MKLDLDLIRDILLDVESWNNAQALTLRGLTYEGKTRQEIGYHLELLDDKGYTDVRIIKGPDGITYDRMKMAGHEYLESVRSPEVWKKIRALFLRGDFPVDASKNEVYP